MSDPVVAASPRNCSGLAYFGVSIKDAEIYTTNFPCVLSTHKSIGTPSDWKNRPR